MTDTDADDRTDAGQDPDPGGGQDEAIRVGDVAVSIPLVLGALAWLAAGALGVAELSVAGTTVRTNALGTGLVIAGFLASAVDRAVAGERGVAAAVGTFAVGLAASYVGRTGGDRTVWVAGGLVMVVSAAGYGYLRFWRGGSDPGS